MTQPAVLAKTPLLIGLDWGTSSLRGYALGAAGQVLDTRRSAHGIMNLPTLPEPQQGMGERFERALQMLCGDWLEAFPQAPVLACGMVGSAQGWREASYQHLPIRVDALAGALTMMPRTHGQSVRIVPGLIEWGDLPNVMRGEETQIAGVLQRMAGEGALPKRMLIGLPGTHSKWALVVSGEITDFQTFMTGEVFGALRHHTILGRTMAHEPDPNPDGGAFTQGLHVARSPAGRTGVLSNIFSCRTLGLTGRLGASAQVDYLSGLLIGHEVLALSHTVIDTTIPVVLCGEPDLCRRYAVALQAYGFDAPRVHVDVTPTGLWRLACDAELV